MKFQSIFFQTAGGSVKWAMHCQSYVQPTGCTNYKNGTNYGSQCLVHLLVEITPAPLQLITMGIGKKDY